jgi:hypothetical protein
MPSRSVVGLNRKKYSRLLVKTSQNILYASGYKCRNTFMKILKVLPPKKIGKLNFRK